MNSLYQALKKETPLQLVGAVNAYSALLAQQAGFRALYLSGAGVANASFGLPDLGITNLADVVEDVRRITGRVDLPLLVDADVGWGGAFNIARTAKELDRAGAAGMHIEDQVGQKRCGHRPGKALVNQEEMVDRIKAAVDARYRDDFVIMARTDALANEGMEGALTRTKAYVEAGADMIFTEAVEHLDQYKTFASGLKVPILANITEFGKTPLFTLAELKTAGVSLALYPLSAFRAMSKAAFQVYNQLRREGTQVSSLNTMQTREELYQILDYYSYEKKLDRLFGKEGGDELSNGDK